MPTDDEREDRIWHRSVLLTAIIAHSLVTGAVLEGCADALDLHIDVEVRRKALKVVYTVRLSAVSRPRLWRPLQMQVPSSFPGE